MNALAVLRVDATDGMSRKKTKTALKLMIGSELCIQIITTEIS